MIQTIFVYMNILCTNCNYVGPDPKKEKFTDSIYR